MNEKMNRFSEMDELNKQFIANAIMYAIKADEVTVDSLIENVPVFNPNGDPLEESAKSKIYHELYILLMNIGIIQNEFQSDGVPKCIVSCTYDLAPDIRNLLNECGYSDEQLYSVFDEVPDDQKTDGSLYLTANPEDKWYHAIGDNAVLPVTGKIVAARIYNPNCIEAKDKKHIYYQDDMILAWLKDDKSWVVEKPYPYIDACPLTTHDKLNEGTVVSHWREATDEEILSWHTRFDPINTYGFLDILVDNDHRKDVYSAIVYGNNLLMKVAKANQGEVKEQLEYLANVLSDIASCIDRNEGIYNEPEQAEVALKNLLEHCRNFTSDAMRDNVMNHNYMGTPEE